MTNPGEPIRGIAVRVGLATLFLYAAFLPPGISNSDGQSMLAVSESMVLEGRLTVPANRGLRAPDGEHYSMHYPLLSVAAAPVVALSYPIANKLGLNAHLVTAAAANICSILFSSVTVALTFLIAVRLGSDSRSALRATLLLAIGTVFLALGREFFAEPLLAMLIAAGFYLSFARDPSRLFVIATTCCMAVLAKPTGAILGFVLTAYWWNLPEFRPRMRLIPVLGSLVGVGLYLAYNSTRFDSPLAFGVADLRAVDGGEIGGFSLARSGEGVAGLLLSPGRGLAWYAPVAVLGLVVLARRRSRETLALAAVFCAFLIIHGAWRGWDSGQWGPRFLMPVIPGLLAATSLVRALRQWPLIGLGVLGLIINAPTLVASYERHYAETRQAGDPAEARPWSLRHAPAVQMWPVAVRQIAEAKLRDQRRLVASAGTDDESVENSEMFNVVAVWWWMLPAVGLPVALGASIAAMLVIASLMVLRSALLLARTPERQPGALGA